MTKALDERGATSAALAWYDTLTRHHGGPHPSTIQGRADFFGTFTDHQRQQLKDVLATLFRALEARTHPMTVQAARSGVSGGRCN